MLIRPSFNANYTYRKVCQFLFTEELFSKPHIKVEAHGKLKTQARLREGMNYILDLCTEIGLVKTFETL